MKALALEIELLEYWHAGSGSGRGRAANASPVIDRHRLPYLPGRTLRGLIRDGVQQAERCLASVPKGTTERVFGNRPDSDTDASGLVRFSDASLPEPLRLWVADQALGRPRLPDMLFRELASTAIEETTGQARGESLRVIDVAVPLTLRGTVHSLDDTLDWNLITNGFGFIRGIGCSRRRGFGRVIIRVGTG